MMINKLLTECFLIKTNLWERPLFAYIFETNQGYGHAKIGRQLVFQLRRYHPDSQWAYCQKTKRLISNQDFSNAVLHQDCLALWQQENNAFESLYTIQQDAGQVLTEAEKGEFIVTQIAQDNRLINEIQQKILNPPPQKNQKAVLQIKRKVQFKSQLIDYQDKIFALLQISIHSEMNYLEKPSVFAAHHGLEALKGLYVENRFQPSSTKSVIQNILPQTLQTGRVSLIAKTKNDKMKTYLATASDTEPLVQVAYKSHPHALYDYALDALQLKPQFKDLERYSNQAASVRQKFFMNPHERMCFILAIAAHIHTRYACVHFEPVTEKPAHPLFFRAPQPVLGTIGQNQVVDLNKNYFELLSQYGCYARLPDAKIGEVRTVVLASGPFNKNLLSKMATGLQPFGIQLVSLDNFKLTYFDEKNASQLEEILQRCISEKVDLILAFIQPKQNQGDLAEEENNDADLFLSEDCYTHLKRLSIQNGIASQVINLASSHNQYILHNTLLGILAKLGHIPYVLNQPLDFVDCIVGLDIGREEKIRTTGSLSTVVATRLFNNHGLFLDYTIENIAIEGETISESVLNQFFNIKFFHNKRVLIHRDGRFRGNEKKHLNKIAMQLNAQFDFVEVVKANLTGMTHPRLYEFNTAQQRYSNPPRGTGFYLDKNRAILVTTPPMNTHATARSLLIEKDGSCSIEEAVRSVIMMTYLHYGSIRAPRLPVTLFASDKIAEMALKRMMPRTQQGHIQYWL